MGFASSWLKSGALFPALINEAPDKKTGIIVVIPAFDELLITETLDSLLQCRQPVCKTEVIVIINASLSASSESLQNNLCALDELKKWKLKNPSCFFRLYPVNLGQPKIKGWGVGLARKTGMDEAARRFDSVDNPEGVILNLDADCKVHPGYLVKVENELLQRKDRKGCSVYFEHPVNGDRFPEEVYNSVWQYELHLRYYFQALAYTGFPNVYHTVGSSIAVKSQTYVKAGGMNRRQAGEDFYFVQKLVSAGGYFSLNSTTVYPSPRPSGRVPFGTGAAVSRMLDEKGTILLTYNPSAFRDLRIFFGFLDEMYKTDPEKMSIISNSFPRSITAFLSVQDWIARVNEIRNNTSGYLSFKKRFFEWYNMFKVVKYLNFSHKSFYEKIPVRLAAEELMLSRDVDPAIAKDGGLLEYYRSLERSG